MDNALVESDSIFKNYASQPDIKMHDKIPDHITWHKDGKLHIKYGHGDKRKTSIDRAQKSLLDIKGKDLLPLLCHSIRIKGSEYSIIFLAVGKGVVTDNTPFPPPYNYFAKNCQSKNVKCLTNISAQNPELCLLFFEIPHFVPLGNDMELVSITTPLQEEDLENVSLELMKDFNLKKKLKNSNQN